MTRTEQIEAEIEIPHDEALRLSYCDLTVPGPPQSRILEIAARERELRAELGAIRPAPEARRARPARSPR